MGIFLSQGDFLTKLRDFARSKPTMGTCAGLILFANHVDGQARDGQTIVCICILDAASAADYRISFWLDWWHGR